MPCKHVCVCACVSVCMHATISLQCVLLLAKTDAKENAMIKQKIYENALLWNGKCVLTEVIPSPPVYYAPGQCTENETFDVWNDAQ